MGRNLESKFHPISRSDWFNARSNTMKLLVLCIFIAGLAATQAKKCDLKKPECVEIFTENETEGPEGPKPKPCDCRKCQADAIALSLTQYCYIPECNEDNTFKAYQYDKVKDESFCFNIYGAEIEGTRQKGPAADCTVLPETTVPPKVNPCAAKKAALAIANPTGIEVVCDANGFYTNVQCVKVAGEAEFCWCTQLNGNMIPGTVKPKGADRVAECTRHVGINHDCYTSNPGLYLYPGRIVPDDCGRYITCAPERAYTCICGDGQYFDYVHQECNWAEKVQCEAEPVPEQKEEK